MAFDWRPRQAGHAIELVALNVNYGEGLSQRVGERIYKAIETASEGQGAVSVQMIQGAKVLNGALVPAPAGVQINTIAESGPAFVGSEFAEQVEAVPISLSYRATVYTSWEATLLRMKHWMTDALTIALDYVPIHSIRLEYQDRFMWEGAGRAIDAGQVLRRDSKLIAPHVFELGDAWHSHTGRFIAGRAVPSVEQLHVGIQDIPTMDGARSMNIMTARENRFASPDESFRQEDVFTTADNMHGELSALLRSVLTDEALASINMTVKS